MEFYQQSLEVSGKRETAEVISLKLDKKHQCRVNNSYIISRLSRLRDKF